MSALLLMFDDGPPFPRSLFAAGEQGIWLDPSDFSTLYQDAAGTTPVTAVGQPVGLALDKSGRGNHASQTTAASRPTLQQDSNGLYYLSFDGTDDGMETPSINFTGTDKMTVWAGVRKLSDATAAAFVELSASANTNNGSFVLFTPLSGGNIVMRHRGSSAFIDATGTPYAAPVTAVVSASSVLGTGAVAVNVNKTPFTTTGVTGGGNFGTYPLYIGRRGGTTLPFNGRLYQLIVRGAASSDGQIAATEAYVNAKTRAY